MCVLLSFCSRIRSFVQGHPGHYGPRDLSGSLADTMKIENDLFDFVVY